MESDSNCIIQPEKVASSEEDKDRIADAPGLSEFRRQKLEKDSKKSWDLFYKRNGDRFFKNRYWTRHEFAELCGNQTSFSNDKILLLEVGCGCGDFVFPLLSDEGSTSNRNLFVYCCDISPVAIDIIKSKPLYRELSPIRMKAFVADITVDAKLILTELEENRMDIVSLVFVLSALDPRKMESCVKNIHQALKPNGLVVFRDYAINDKAMMRFKPNSKISDQFYVRQDGTRAYFFSKEYLKELFEMNHFTCEYIEYMNRETINNATGDRFKRIFLQAKFRSVEISSESV